MDAGALEYGYNVFAVQDACASVSAELHEFSIRHVLPRIARVVHAADIVLETHSV